ncbi:MAG TPA: hypothetical protein GX728_02595 [Clostridiaceae bacterium]|jgi:hypothetical protein|nr:hypothetical protein [Clostridiaceae bacterium]
MDRHMLLDTYQKLEERLAKLDFASLWPRFAKPSYALYTDESMCFDGELLPKPDHFYGNTAIEYEGKMIAIWMLKSEQIETDTDLDRLTARIVHEMFHVFQMENGESRFPNDLELIAFPLDAKLVALAYRENDLLGQFADMMKTVSTTSGDNLQEQRLDAMTTLRRMAEIRNEMRTLSDGATINEWRVETLEGIAEHVGFKALRQLNGELAAKEIDVYVEYLRKATDAIDHRGRGYHTGLFLPLLAETAELDFDRNFTMKKTLWELFEQQIVAATGKINVRELILTDEELERAHATVDRERRRRADILNSFQTKFPVEKPVQASICGYDPMNFMRVDDYLISTSFLMIDQEGEKRRLMGEHLLRMKPGDYWAVETLYVSE